MLILNSLNSLEAPPRALAAPWFRAACVAAVVLIATLQASPTAAAATSPTVCVMTFNLRYASPTPPNSWPERRPIMRACIESVKPDLIGTQEGLYMQLRDLEADLPDYAWIGLGRDGGSRGEFMAIFYRRARFTPVEFDHFWLSDTPDIIGSSTWGNRNRRMVTWVKFKDEQADQLFYFVNTHFDHEIQKAREESARLMRQRLETLTPSLPLILLGDFNAVAENNAAYDLLVKDTGLSDTWLTAQERRGNLVSTFHNYRGPSPAGHRIDWILTRGKVAVTATEIITFERQGQYPSDHFPVVAWLQWGAAER
jgi:endonuclease/exonuclease/phosphatase family metal-dependent hydrolase